MSSIAEKSSELATAMVEIVDLLDERDILRVHRAAARAAEPIYRRDHLQHYLAAMACSRAKPPSLSSPRNRGKELPSTGSRGTKRAGHE